MVVVFVAVVVTVIIMVIVFVAVVITVVAVVVMCVASKHLENCHCEVFCIVCIKFHDVFTFFKMEEGNHCVSRTSCRV